jgi:RNA polymerase sigma-70 factor, ECF subfamily
MLGQFRNEFGKRAVASSCDAAADEELVAAAKNGDELGFESLAKRHQRRIFALAFRYTRVREDAEDIVQETFKKAFVHLQKFEGKSSFSTWLTRIAINESLMSLRRRRTLHEVSADDSNGDNGTTPGPDLTDASPDPEATYLQKEVARIVSAAIRHLRP